MIDYKNVLVAASVWRFVALTQVRWDESAVIACEKIAEYAYAVVKGKPHFHINFIMNVSPECDC